MDNDYTEREFADDFIALLKKYKESSQGIYFQENEKKNMDLIKSARLSSYLNFKAYICELFYQAINSIPHTITEYTITTVNNKVKNQIVIGLIDDIDDEGEISVAKVITPDHIFVLNKTDVHNIYIANRSNLHDKETVNSIMMLLYLDGNEPIVKTSYKAAKSKANKIK